MPDAHSLIVELEERSQSGTARLGTADLTAAASAAIRRGESWTGDRVPATAEVCAAVGHRARLAAWQGRLYSKGFGGAFAAFARTAEKSGTDKLEFHVSVLQAARRVAAHAAWLAETAARAKTEPWPADGLVCCPLSGEITDCLEASALDAPFAFGVIEGMFAGIDPRGFADFLRDCDGALDAAEYLSHSLRFPELWFTDTYRLDMAGFQWLETGDFSAFSAAVGLWNRMQRVGMPFCDISRIHLQRSETRDTILGWCRDHVSHSLRLVEGIKEQSFTPSR